MGNIPSKETRNKISVSMMGMSRSNETRRKMSESTVGFKNHKSKLVLNTQTGVFYTVREASDSVELRYKTLMAMLNGQNSNKTNLIYC